MEDKIIGKKIAFITAHPDDEAVLSSGTINKNIINGGSCVLYCASLGEKGRSCVDETVSIDDLKQIRKEELMSVSEYLGIINTEIGDFEDGHLMHYINEIKNDVRVFIEKERPDIIVSFGRDGYTGHRDHITVGEISREIAKEMSIPFFTFSGPSTNDFPEFYMHLSKRRKHGTYHNEYIKDHIPHICIQIDRDVKSKCLQMYKTQYEGINPHNIFPKEIALHVLENEYFCETKNVQN